MSEIKLTFIYVFCFIRYLFFLISLSFIEH